MTTSNLLQGWGLGVQGWVSDCPACCLGLNPRLVVGLSKPVPSPVCCAHPVFDHRLSPPLEVTRFRSPYPGCISTV